MTGIASGLGGGVVVANESVYGTWVTPTRAIEVHSAKLQEREHIVQGTGLAYGRSVDPGGRRVNTWSDGGGDIEMEFLSTGMGLILAAIMGTTATLTAIGTTTAYQLAASYGVPDYGAAPSVGSFSLQTLVPDTGGNIKQQNFHGCKITKATFSIERGGLLMLTYTVDAQQWENSNAAVVPTYGVTAQNFSALGMSFNVGAYGSEAALDGVRKFELSIERTLKVDRIYVGDTVKNEPVTSGITKISGSMDVDLLPSNKATVWDLYHSQAAIPSIVAAFTGSAIGSSGHNNALTLNPTECFIDSSGTPELDGPDVVTATLPFTGLIDTANDSPLKATLVTADSGF